MGWLTVDGAGCTRHVVLMGHWAVKVPRLNYGWKLFLGGLLANMQEVTFSATGDERLCPVVFAGPGGTFLVMRRARVMTDEEYEAFDWVGFVMGADTWQVPAEAKSDSFGWLDGRWVAVDYGS